MVNVFSDAFCLVLSNMTGLRLHPMAEKEEYEADNAPSETGDDSNVKDDNNDDADDDDDDDRIGNEACDDEEMAAVEDDAGESRLLLDRTHSRNDAM